MKLSWEKNFSHEIENYEPGIQGFSAQTWVNDKFVIQRRFASIWPRVQMTIRILEKINSDPDNILIGFKHEYELKGNDIWFKFKRFDKKRSPAHNPNPSDSERIDYFTQSLEDYFKTREFIRKIKADEKTINEFLTYRPSAKEKIRRFSERRITAAAQSFGYNPPISYPDQLPFSFQHGDLSLGNTILTKDGYRMIDWENFSFQEGGGDIDHLFVFLLLPLPLSWWKGVVDDFSKPIANHLSIAEEEWRKRIYWEMMREFIFWQKGQGIKEKANFSLKALGF